MIVHQFPPQVTAGVFRTVRFTKYLPAFGWTPIVLTATPAELIGDESLSNPASGSPAAVSADIRVERTAAKHALSRAKITTSAARPTRKPSPGKQSHAEGGVRRFARKSWQFLTETPDPHVRWVATAVLRGRRLIRETRPDVLYTSGPPHSVHLAGAILKRLTGRPWIADFRDPWARRPWKKVRNPWGERLLGRFERACIRRADAVVLNTETAASDFRNAYPKEHPDKFYVVTNGCDPELASHAAELNRRFRREQAADFLLLHPGSCYGRRDPRPVVDAVAALAARGIHVRFEQVGHCASAFALLEYARERGVEDRVSVEPAVPHEVILQRMAAADALLLLQPDAPLMVPGKLYEMLPFRKPIVAVTDEGATAEIVRRFGLGPVVRSGDAAALAESLESLIAPSGKAIVDSAGVDDALCEFDGEALTGRLADIFDAVTAPATNAAEDRTEAIDEPQTATASLHRQALTTLHH